MPRAAAAITEYCLREEEGEEGTDASRWRVGDVDDDKLDDANVELGQFLLYRRTRRRGTSTRARERAWPPAAWIIVTRCAAAAVRELSLEKDLLPKFVS